ncbi:MAG: SMP-30/gluconolactonase/LRE family protein [Chloroflexota bacterium]
MSWQFETITNLGSITEGPAWDGTSLLYTSIATNRVMRLDPATSESVAVRTGTNGANGLMLSKDGTLYACEGGGRRMVCYNPIAGDASTGITVICDNFEGKRLNSPNDLAIDSQGRIWFTDPRYGDFRDDMELDHESVYRLDPHIDGTWTCTRMTFDTTAPNGLLLAPDEKTLYVAQSKYGDGGARELRAYAILEDGSLAPGQVLHNFYPHRGIDGMCWDADGYIIATAGWEESGPGGMIYVFETNGRVVETHPVPANRPTNCTFGGPELSTLYVTSTDGHLLKAKTDRRGPSA